VAPVARLTLVEVTVAGSRASDGVALMAGVTETPVASASGSWAVIVGATLSTVIVRAAERADVLRAASVAVAV
jgi:hypothetical protein